MGSVVSPVATRHDADDPAWMEPELSVPVIWTEDGGAPFAGRIDLTALGVHLDGGSRDDRRTVDLPYTEIASVRIDRNREGRRAVVLALGAGGEISFTAFDRPGSVLELAHRVEERL